LGESKLKVVLTQLNSSARAKAGAATKSTVAIKHSFTFDLHFQAAYGPPAFRSISGAEASSNTARKSNALDRPKVPLGHWQQVLANPSDLDRLARHIPVDWARFRLGRSRKCDFPLSRETGFQFRGTCSRASLSSPRIHGSVGLTMKENRANSRALDESSPRFPARGDIVHAIF
jgi:hypothetical protein